MNEVLHGRRIIRTDETVVTADNVVGILQHALLYHMMNREEIDYLWKYYKGVQPITDRVKQIRPEICNRIVENRANEIVSFKSSYLMGEPVQFVGCGEGADSLEELNMYLRSVGKASKDKQLADWFHICGLGYRIVLANPDRDSESPFEIYTLDPRNTFVVYSNDLGEKPVMGVRYVVKDSGEIIYTCYTEDSMYEVSTGSNKTSQGIGLVGVYPHTYGMIPIIEYPLNIARMGAFELVISMLDAINLCDSNRLDGLEQFVQAIMLFHNVDISKEDYESLREEGALKFRDVDQSMRADVTYLVNTLDQNSPQTLVDHMYQTVLTICGMPSTSDGSTSDSSNNGAVILRNGWQSAEARAKDTELYFKESEKQTLKLLNRICGMTVEGFNLSVGSVEIRFTRRNYENIYQKSQVLDLMLNNGKVHPKLAFEHSGLFVDPELAYSMSEKYAKEQEKKSVQLVVSQNQEGSEVKADEENES